MGKPMSPEEYGYRRGFDQGFYFALHWIGMTNAQVQGWDYKRKLGNWRHARGAFSKKDFTKPPVPTEIQKEMMRYYVNKQLSKIISEQLDAQNNY